MSGLSRRMLLRLGVGLAAVGGLAMLARPSPRSLPARVTHHLETQFGPEVAESEAGRAFRSALLERLTTPAGGAPGPLRGVIGTLVGEDGLARLDRFVRDRSAVSEEADKELRAQVVRLFLQSTTFIEAGEDPAATEFVALFDPYETPCLNQLWRPSDMA